MDLLNLTKTLELNLAKADILVVPKMAVKLAVDKSGSMDDEFRAGWVQDTVDLFLAAAIKFDDDGNLEMGFFNTSFDRTPDATAADEGVYINKHRIRAGGGTNFAGAIKGLKGKAKSGIFGFGKAATPTYLALITDGDNTDKVDFEYELGTLENTFVQIVAIGNGCDSRYLNQVASKYKNVSVIFIPNPASATPDKFYEMLLNDQLKAFIK